MVLALFLKRRKLSERTRGLYVDARGIFRQGRYCKIVDLEVASFVVLLLCIVLIVKVGQCI